MEGVHAVTPPYVWVSLSRDDGTPRGVWPPNAGPGSALPSAHRLVKYVLAAEDVDEA